MEVKTEEYAFPAEALEALDQKDEEELSHEQKIALENLERHCKVKDIGTAEEIYEELSAIDSLKDKHVYKLLELVPKHESTVRAIFQKERVKLEDSEIDQILEICRSVETE